MITWQHELERREHWTRTELHLKAYWSEDEYDYLEIGVWPDSYHISLANSTWDAQTEIDHGTLLTIISELPREVRKIWPEWPVASV